MIDKWKAKLGTYGFNYKKWSSSEKAFVRYVGSIQQQIWEQRVINEGPRILINTCISIVDSFKLEQGINNVLPILAYRLTDNEVVLPKSDASVGKYWKIEESNEAFDSLVKYALPWFEENSTLDKLIDYVANDVVVRPKFKQDVIQNTSFIKNLFLSKHTKKHEESEIIVSPINQLKLSLLYYHADNIQLACEHAREWLKYGKNRTGEPDRTLRQLKEMGCSQIEDLVHDQ